MRSWQHPYHDQCLYQGQNKSQCDWFVSRNEDLQRSSQTDRRCFFPCSLQTAQDLIVCPGTYGVVVNEAHFKDLLFESVPPPATSSSSSSNSRITPGADIMQMGFPTMLSNIQYPTLCSCHSKLKTSGFICPRCRSQVCEVPSECGVCGLTIVSSPHLARSYRHLFPVKNFVEISAWVSLLSVRPLGIPS